VHPILGRYGPFFLYSYTAIMGLGLAAAVGLTHRLAPRRPAAAGWLDALLAGLVGAVIGGRIGYVAAHWDYFRAEPDEIGLVWAGGLGYHGALAGGLLGLWLWSRWRGRSFVAIAGLVAPGLALAHAFGWLACWFEGCAYGREAALGLLAADLPDSYGVYAVRYQTQVIGLGLSLAAFAVVMWRWSRLAAGPAFALTLLLLSAGRAAVSLLRGDEALMIGAVRLETAIEGALALGAMEVLLGAAAGRRRRKNR
jgi:phosphatidylglycerol:prolipoprotein diacylglycerol transferase